MSLKSIGSQRGGGEVLRTGLLKKLKTSRKKWFVLRAETQESSARLEYYDSEKKFNSGQAPKRSIPLKTCFNINKRHDTKHKHVIALYTKDDCFCVVLDSEEELESWLKALLSLQHGEEAADGETPRPTFEHVWQVTVLNRGLGTGRTGNYRLCLTDKTLCLVKKDCNKSVINLYLANIRSCGCLKHYFFLEIGRSSLLGAGELWMECEDTTIAQNIHTTIFHAMNTKHDEMRVRSSSATESSKPTNRKQVASGAPKATTHLFNAPAANHGVVVTSSPGTTISHQRTQSLPLTDHPPMVAPSPLINTTNSSISTDIYIPFQPCTRAMTTTTTVIVNKSRSNQTAKCRERCATMPTRSRTASEGTQPLPWRPYLAPNRSHGRDISHSPPTGSPISPPSVGCSTDSAGSSYSLTDETDMMCLECPDGGRYNSIPLTPDEAIAEEDCPESPCGMYDSYVPMAPHSSDDGYVDMSPRCRHTTHSPTASVSSIVSGTPSTDIRFSDYPLDKVSSYLASDDDSARPTRAYSFGSKPETYKGKKHVELSDSARVRAFSVGSKIKKGPSRILPHQQHPSLKSISAPILSNSRSHSSHSSFDPMDDMMEMDFSNNGLNNNAGTTPSGTTTTTNNGYVEMKPGVEIVPKKPEVSPYVDMSGSSYMDMSGSSPSSRHEEEYTSFVDINRQYRLPTNNNYMDMDARRNKVKPSTSPAWSNDYFDMSGNSRRSERGSSFSSQLSTSSSPRNADYLSMNFSPHEPPKTPEGYVEMTIGKKHQRQGSLDGNQSVAPNEDYLNMSVSAKKKPSKGSKVASQPISIHSATTTSQVTKQQHSSSPISISSLLGRKSSTGTPPKMHLSLSSWSTSSPYSSLPRQRPRKDSRDSSSSSVTTPSSSSTIFPMSLNSPSSPLKASKADTPSGKTPSSMFSTHFKGNRTNSSDDYAVMDFEVNRYDKEKEKEKEKENSDYVNYSPAAIERSDRFERSLKKENSRSSGDYAVMQPGAAAAAAASRVGEGIIGRSGSLDTSPLIGHLSLIGIKETQSMCFQPIKEDALSSPVEDYKRLGDSMDTSDYAELNPSTSNSDCVSPAAKISRPNSVNSDSAGGIKTVFAPLARCSSDKSRPASVSSDTSRSASSRPSSTSSELWSSSSTLVNSRPGSVNSDRIEPVPSSNQSKTNKQEDKPENKLHYASLDLTGQEEEGRSPRSTKGSSSGSIEANAASGSGETPTFVYAEIDFVKSEDLKQNNNNNQSLGNSNTKV